MVKIKNLFNLLWILLLLFTFNVSGARVGIVVSFPDGTSFSKCVDVNEGENGYSVLNKAGLSIEWSYHTLWGHSLCSINGFGCPSDNCWCEYPKYWGFFIKGITSSSWKYSSVGFDGGSSCSEHYCAKDKDMIGLAYGEYGTKPADYSFDEVCPPEEKRRIRKFVVSITPKEPKEGETITIEVINNKTMKGIRNAEVDVFTGIPGISKKVFSGKTNEDGYLNFTLSAGIYKIRVNVPKYNPSQHYSDISVSKLITTTTTTTTTTITTTTSTTMLTTTTTIYQTTTLITTTTTTTTTTTI